MAGTLLLTRGEVQGLLDLPSCIDAVEKAFLAAAQGITVRRGVLGIAAEGGGFHAKAALLGRQPHAERAYFAAKLNANFPANPRRVGLPTIQGVVALFDGETGLPLAVMDSISITILRTAAATGIAARHLARAESATATIVGCGAQALTQLAALCAVRPIARAFAFDLDRAAAVRFANLACASFGIAVQAADELRPATLVSDIIVTCTPARRTVLGVADVSPGALVSAVGADSEDKQEIDANLMAHAAVIVDDLEQCAAIGDLHHAIRAGVMASESVRGDLASVVAGRTKGRRDPDEIVVFDSTGVAIQDVAAAALVYERARTQGCGTYVELNA